MSDQELAAKPPPEVAQAFTAAALTVLLELTRIEAYALRASQENAVTLAESVVSASMLLVREVPGKMSLILTAEIASQLAARYLPEGTVLVDDLIDDVAGEFANVIAGQAKTILKGTAHHFTLSTPVVARAASFAQLHDVPESVLVISLNTELGLMLLHIDLPPCTPA